jgi:hypothetical protein
MRHYLRAAWPAVAVLMAVVLPVRPAQAQGAALRQQIEQRFDVLPLRTGMALQPRSPQAGIKTIEISDGTIAIDGVLATGAELRSRLGADADLVIQLSYLDQAGRQALFGTAAPAGPQPPATPPAAPPPPSVEPPPAPPPPEPPAAGRRDTRRGDRVRIGGGVTVEAGEIVFGDAVAIGGTARVDGEVRGDVVSVGGSVVLGPRAVVTNDVVVVGGRLERDPSARIDGEVNEVGMGPVDLSNWSWGGFRPDGFRPFGSAFALLATVGRIVFLSLLAALVVLLAREHIEGVSTRAAAEPLKAGAIGVLSQLLFLPALITTIVLLVVTIVGIPLLALVPFAILGLLLVALVGFTAVAYRVGAWALSRIDWGPRGPYASTIAGIVVLAAPLLLARLLGLVGGGLLVPITFALMAIGFVLEYLAWTVGFGAVALSRLGRRPPAEPTTVPA